MSDPKTTDPRDAEIERLRADNRIMAQRLMGISPDRNTQTEAEADATEDLIEAAARRALS